MHIKKARKTIDRTSVRLPPVWQMRERKNSPRREEWNDSIVRQTGPARSAANRAVNIIDNAQDMIVACSFLLADQEVLAALVRATARGVRVYTMIAAETRLLSEPPDHDRTDLAEWKRRVVDEFKESLRRLGGRALIRASDSFHAKVVVADPATRPAGMLFTANLTTEALERNQELAVELFEQQVRDITALLRWGFWEASTHEIIDPKDSGLSPIRPLQSVAHPPHSDSFVSTTAQSNGIRAALLTVVRSESREIRVASFGWGVDHEVVRALVERARAGVRVIVFARPRAAAMPALIALREAGATVLGFEFLHAKALWTSSGSAYVMTANLEPHGLDSGFELGVALSNSAATTLESIFSEWEQAAEWELLAAPLVGSVMGRIQLWKDGRLNDEEVRPEAHLAVPRREIASAELLATAEPSAPRDPLPLAHTIHVEGDVVAPTLPQKAKEVLREVRDEKEGTRREPYSPRVFTHAGRTLVVVRTPGDLAAANQLRNQLGADAIVFDGAAQ